jgi:hypothetical protein
MLNVIGNAVGGLYISLLTFFIVFGAIISEGVNIFTWVFIILAVISVFSCVSDSFYFIKQRYKEERKNV